MRRFFKNAIWCGTLLALLLAFHTPNLFGQGFKDFKQEKKEKEAKDNRIFYIKSFLTSSDLFDPVRKNRLHKVHVIKLKKNQSYTIQVYGNFNTYLRLEDSKRRTLKDNAGWKNSHNSCIVTKPVADEGLYRIVVSSLNSGETGSYTLQVFEGKVEILVP